MTVLLSLSSPSDRIKSGKVSSTYTTSAARISSNGGRNLDTSCPHSRRETDTSLLGGMLCLFAARLASADVVCLSVRITGLAPGEATDTVNHQSSYNIHAQLGFQY